jgi:hypothetical protein
MPVNATGHLRPEPNRPRFELVAQNSVTKPHKAVRPPVLGAGSCI